MASEPNATPTQRVFLVVVDRSPELKVALRFACRRARASGGRVAMLYVPEPANVLNGVSVLGESGTKVVPDAADVRYGTSVGTTTGTLEMPNGGTPTGTQDATSDSHVKSGSKYGSPQRTGSAASGYTYGDSDASKVLTTATGAGTYQAVAASAVQKGVAVGVSPAVGTLVGIVDSGGSQHDYGTCSSAQAYAATGVVHDSGTVSASGTLKSDGTYNATGILYAANSYASTGILAAGGYVAKGIFDGTNKYDTGTFDGTA
jgi:hypothetical protein